MNPLPLNPNGRLSRGSMSSETACRKRHVAPQLGWTLCRHHPMSQPPNWTNRCELMFAPQQSVGDWSWSVLLIFLAPHACAIMPSRSHPIQRRDVSFCLLRSSQSETGLEASCWFSSLRVLGAIWLLTKKFLGFGYYFFCRFVQL